MTPADQKMIAEYSAEYCRFLELAYGKNWMSEGGEQAAEQLCAGLPLVGKRILDVGAGLGGLAFYLAEQFDAKVTGLELNPWMVEEATRRVPYCQRGQVNFCAYTPPTLPFEHQHFDCVISKGVLVHVEDKLPLFKAFHRVLKPGGTLLINDWLSPTAGQWGKKVEALCEAESLTLYAHTLMQYKNWITEAGFSLESVTSEDAAYIQYNQDIVSHLKAPENQAALLDHSPQSDWLEAMEGYQSIADAITQGELLIRCFLARA